MHVFKLVCLAIVSLMLASCASTRGGSIPYDVQAFGEPDAPKPLVINDSYKLGPLDTVAVNVFQVADLSKDYVIDLSGNVTMPLVGQVSAIGLSTTEFATKLSKALGERYLEKPNVTVALKDSARRVLTIEGSVRQPGLYPATGPMTLVQAVAMARGVDDFGNPKRVAIFRQIEGKRMAAAFDLVSIRRGEAQDPDVYAGDTIIVDGSSVRKAQREILQNLPVATFIVPFL